MLHLKAIALTQHLSKVSATNTKGMQQSRNKRAGFACNFTHGLLMPGRSSGQELRKRLMRGRCLSWSIAFADMSRPFDHLVSC